MSLLLAINRRTRRAIWKQIVEGITHVVDDGALRPGARLPPTRALAASLGVNRSTAYRAYQELWALGYLESRPGSYSTVRARPRPTASGGRGREDVFDWEAVSSAGARGAYDALAREPARVVDRRLIDFHTLSVDQALSPVAEFRRAVRAVLAERGEEVLDYGDPAGYGPLREVIARRMRVHGVGLSADQILVTHGAQQAIELAVTLLARPGAVAALESPTYSHALPIFRLHGLALRAIPARADGLDLDVFERVAAAERLALLYTIPNFHNPTGITTSQAHRERLLAICARHGVPIVEDGFEEEMKYTGRAVLPIKSMDRRGLVVYVGTFSKVLSPGLRVGWIAADRDCLRRLLAVSRFCNLSGNILGQAALARFCDDGAYEAHLRRIHRVYRRRMQTMLAALEAHMPPGEVEWTKPAGGYTLWLRVKIGSSDDDAQLERAAAQQGVAITPGRCFFPGEPDGLYARLSIARAPEELIPDGCRRLAQAIRRLGSR